MTLSRVDTRRLLTLGTAVVVLFCATPSRAEFFIGAQVGAGRLQLHDLEDSWSEFGVGYDDDDLALQWELSATWRFAERHAIRLSVERITTEVILHHTVDFDPPTSMGFFWSEQNFETLPVSASYEFAMWCSQGRAATLIGLGGGIYFSEIEGDVVLYHDDPVLAGSFPDSREGKGYGFHLYLRQTAPITDRLFLSGSVRGRWADGMAFDDDARDIPMEIFDFDVVIGLEWEIQG